MFFIESTTVLLMPSVAYNVSIQAVLFKENVRSLFVLSWLELFVSNIF